MNPTASNQKTSKLDTNNLGNLIFPDNYKSSSKDDPLTIKKQISDFSMKFQAYADRISRNDSTANSKAQTQSIPSTSNQILFFNKTLSLSQVSQNASGAQSANQAQKNQQSSHSMPKIQQTKKPNINQEQKNKTLLLHQTYTNNQIRNANGILSSNKRRIMMPHEEDFSDNGKSNNGGGNTNNNSN